MSDRSADFAEAYAPYVVGSHRTIAEVKEVAQKLSLRLSRVRDELLTRIQPSVRWMVPDVSALLKGAKVKLSKSSFTAKDDDGEDREIEIDEDLNVEGFDIPRLMRVARAEWCALTWLCWGCGLNKIGMPIKVQGPADYGQAAGMAQQRLWRARDLRVMGPREVEYLVNNSESSAMLFGEDFEGVIREAMPSLPIPKTGYVQVGGEPKPPFASVTSTLASGNSSRKREGMVEFHRPFMRRLVAK